MRIQKVDNSVSFARKPDVKEMKIYTKSINDGLKLLDKKVDIIIHNASAPAVAEENTGIGSLFSKTTFTKLFPFLKEHGFTGIQQEPNGLRKVLDNSPYAPESSAKNIYMIPLEKLASDEYGNILSKKTFNAIVKNNPDKENVNYPYIRSMYDVALKEAYNNAKDSPEFLKFKAENEQKYETSALYRIISKLNGDDNFMVWGFRDDYSEDEFKKVMEFTNTDNWYEEDKNLITKRNTKASRSRILELKTRYKDDYELFIFEQMILEKENAKANELSNKTGIKIIGDSPVAPTSVEVWTNKDLFLEGKAIGCPPDYFSPTGQRWGFPYYDPKKIFNKDGSLGEAGKILKQKYEEYFKSFSGGIRIDHIIGLIDPFIYTTTSKEMTASNSGRIYSTEGGKYQKHSINEYAELLTKIIIPAAEKFGLNKESIICEDLGDPNKPTQQVMKKLNLSGISVTQFDYRGSKAPKRNVIMLGSHDNQSFLEFIADFFRSKYKKDTSHRFLKKTRNLAEDTIPQNATIKDFAENLKEIRKNPKEFFAASIVELFASPARRIQIFFADFWGLGKTYNHPGTTQGNWALRLNDNFEEAYYKAAAEGNAPNLPKAIARALRHRGLDKGQEELMKNLDDSAKIISEK